jgi:KDO2-lipid IV(A) lauroyltransferase
MKHWYYNLRNIPLRAFASTIIWLVKILPENAAYGFGRCLALMFYHLHRRWRCTSLRNLELLFKDELDARQRLRIFRESAIHLGYGAIEFIRMGSRPVEEGLAMVVETEGLHHLEEAKAKGNGVIALSMHYGSWELAGSYLASKVGTLHAVFKEQRDQFFTDLTFPWRERYGIKLIMAGDKANSAILRALNSGDILGLIADQNGGKVGTFAPFAGIPASTVLGPAALGLKSGAPLILAFCRRLAPGKHKLIVKPPLDMSNLPEDKQEARVEILCRMNKLFEEVLREDPSQWLLGHKRWKTRPPGEPWLY